jgi:hypothetical protein
VDSTWETSLSDTHAETPGTLYYYWVKASYYSNGDNPSGYSGSDQGYRKLSTVTNVTATDGAAWDTITVSWSTVTGASYYRVYRSTSSDPASAVALSSWQTNNTYPDNIGLTSNGGRRYYYWVYAATDASGNRPSDRSTSYDSGYTRVYLKFTFTGPDTDSQSSSYADVDTNYYSGATMKFRGDNNATWTYGKRTWNGYTLRGLVFWTWIGDDWNWFWPSTSAYPGGLYMPRISSVDIRVKAALEVEGYLYKQYGDYTIPSSDGQFTDIWIGDFREDTESLSAAAGTRQFIVGYNDGGSYLGRGAVVQVIQYEFNGMWYDQP